MASKEKFAGTVSQTTGGKYCTFSNLNNIRNSTEGSWAVSSVLVQGKAETPNRPSTITGTNFQFNLPTGAEPTKVKVTYRHMKVAGSDWTSKGKEIMNIPAPTISLVGTHNTFSGKGVAPTLDMKTSTKTFNVTGKLSRAAVNGSGFGFKLNYPTNTNAYNGYLRVSYVTVTVEYKVPSYSVSVKKVSGGYNQEDYTVQLSISNKNKTAYNPSLTLSSPVGFSFKSSKGTGVLTQNSARSFTWNPKITAKSGTNSINVVFTPDVTYPSGSSSYSGQFTLSESLNGTTGTHTATITERPPSEHDEDAPDEQYVDTETDEQSRYYQVTVGEEFTYTFTLTDEELENYTNIGINASNFQYKVVNPGGTAWYNITDGMIINSLMDGNNFTMTLRAKNVGACTIEFVDNPVTVTPTHIATFNFDVRPEEDDLSIPFLALMELSDEELDRLGTGYPYIAETIMKHTTDDTFERDWYKNNRIGVFNNPIEDNITVETVEVDGEYVDIVTDTTDYDNLTVDDIFENAEYWSNALSTVNSYESLECEFTYNDDYPLYILLTGDYTEAEDYGYDMGTITYTEPAIIEKTVYQGREKNGNYPIPISALISEDTSSEQEVQSNNQSTPIILYNYPLEDGYGTTDTLSVRGIEVIGNIEQSDELVISAKLISDTGIVGERTTIVNNEDTTIDSDTSFKLGGLGDLWGFQTTDITNLEDWELQLTINNILLEDVANINYGPITIIIYVERLEKQLINVKVNGEDLSYYGAFVEEANIPSGLDTDTDFLTIDGTDTNDAYRQNIREKEITLVFSIGECDLGTSTDMLRQITKLLVNDKDTYNRPIPNRIEFSHYPDVYFEYIMKDAMTINSEQSYYDVTAKLIIPAGTSYSKETTTTNITGNVQGLAAISPTISFKPQGEVIEIREQVSNQRFSMGYSGDWQSKIVELDCANRIAWLKTNEDDTEATDISKYVDFNSDWFALKGEYAFSATNCTIRRVEYTERW